MFGAGVSEWGPTQLRPCQAARRGGQEGALAMLALVQLLSCRLLSAFWAPAVPNAWTALPSSTVRAQLGVTYSERPSLTFLSLIQAPHTPTALSHRSLHFSAYVTT